MLTCSELKGSIVVELFNRLKHVESNLLLLYIVRDKKMGCISCYDRFSFFLPAPAHLTEDPAEGGDCEAFSHVFARADTTKESRESHDRRDA